MSNAKGERHDELLILGVVSFIAFIIRFLSDKRRITNGVLLTSSVVFILLGLGATLTEGPMNRLDQIVLFNLLLIGHLRQFSCLQPLFIYFKMRGPY
ncbi:hypothetical protein [Bacillus sp. JCM 19041]|uniref:hypothetical protein n=1 Tax=Bacillus sp. JCM 19041 TaxID=1460637 RepID=UPI0006D1B229